MLMTAAAIIPTIRIRTASQITPGQQKYERKDHRCNSNYNRKPLNDNFSCSSNDCKLHKEIKAFKNAAGTCPCSIFTQIQIIAIPRNFERCLEHLCYDSRCCHEQNENQCHQNKLEWTEDHAGAIIPPIWKLYSDR